MKASEYKLLLDQAKKDSVELRWNILKDKPDYIHIVPNCQFCTLAFAIAYWKLSCYSCPLNTNKGCADGIYEKWIKSRRIATKRRYALKIIDMINAVNVGEHTQMLVDTGVLEDDL
jgi:hypothetical protein